VNEGQRLRRRLAAVLVVVAFGPLATTCLPSHGRVSVVMSAQSPSPIWTGVFTDAQVGRGRAAYERNCSRCHRTDLSGDEGIALNGELYQTLGPALKGGTFFKDWGHGSLNRLFRKIRDAMPPDFQSIVDDRTKIDVVAFLLHENGFPAGAAELTRDPEMLEQIQIVEQNGEHIALPNFALVQVVGCLEPGPGSRWTLGDATQPTLSRDGPLLAVDLKMAETRPRGSERFLLVNASPFSPKEHRGHRMAAKGLLYREPEENRLTLSSLQMVDSVCQN
jgi:hypothetical protein